LQILYEYDCTKQEHKADAIIERFFFEQSLDEDLQKFIQESVLGVIDNQGQIDNIIREYASAWPLEQISAIDKNILRLAIFESLINSIPHKVAINEAVELAKTFGSDNSARFVNGVLGAVHDKRKENNDTGDHASLN